MIIDLNRGERVETLLAKHNKVILDIYANWCGPCKMVYAELEKFAAERPEWVIVRVDIDKHVSQSYQYHIQSVPTLVFCVGGEQKEVIVGYKPYEEIKKIASKY